MSPSENGVVSLDSPTPINCDANAPICVINGFWMKSSSRAIVKQYYLWRAVDGKGNVFDILMQRHRDPKAAKRFFRKLLKQQGFAPRVLVTDKLKSYEAAKKQMLKSVEQRQHKVLNNPCKELPSTDSNAIATNVEV